ncbi:helix-turn-helix domain-containing protein [Paenarthrobacter sp. JL.01a]|uniref:helix-turn-helix domain-containing protein n=1 Tax=Paenarthrobacter sp. JL.01a TaxID=2979324 RepID=UPI0021C7DC66|nr:helix-turn-helix domain-containing protein [Paenarthrobacter sp. JL.01a]UXM93620.1 helix-turn-helix domain-containing protein [Paenarthrobacter sp. JL.01a]
MKCTPSTGPDHFSRDAHAHRGEGIKRYTIPAGLDLEEKFEHWRCWYGSAIDTPARLEKTERQIRPGFNPTALSLEGPGFSLVDVVNEPAICHWRAPAPAQNWLVYFRSSCAGFSFSGRSEEISPGTVRFLDHSAAGSFHAPKGLSAVRIHFDRQLLGLGSQSIKRLEGLADIRDHPLVRGLILPALTSWQDANVDREVGRLQPVYRSMMTGLIGSLLETRVDAEDVKPARIAAVKKFMRRNYRNPDLGVEQVVAYSHLSRRALYYLFEAEALQVNKFIRALRTIEALELLSDANSWMRSLANIAEASGFTNLQAMRRAVKDATGPSLSDLQDQPGLAQIHAAGLRKLLGS